jgi:GT2 family glycosyltransferase
MRAGARPAAEESHRVTQATASGNGVVISAIVVNHRRPELTEACVASLRAALEEAGRPYELIVIENGSGDDSHERLHALEGIELLPLRVNVGFAAAMQVAFERSRGAWLLMLNNDATIERRAVAELLAVGEADRGVGSVAAQMRFADAPGVINAAGIEVDRLGVSFERRLGEPVAASEDEPVEVFGAHGAAALHRREMLREVGGFDPSFFFGLDDVDLAWRARMAGWRTIYAPGAVVYHANASTATHASSFKYEWIGRARVRTLAKNADSSQLMRYGAAIVGYELAYVAWAAWRHRTLAPLRGRVRGLREWRMYRRAGEPQRLPLELAPVRGLRAALDRRAASARYSSVTPAEEVVAQVAREPDPAISS